MYTLTEIIAYLNQNLQFYKKFFAGFHFNQTEPVEITEIIKEEMRIVEDIFEFRIKRVNEIENPYLPPVIHQEYVVNVAGENQIQPEALVSGLLQLKEDVFKYVTHLHPARLSRTGYHWQEGHITLENLLNRYLRNDLKFREKLESLTR